MAPNVNVRTASMEGKGVIVYNDSVDPDSGNESSNSNETLRCVPMPTIYIPSHHGYVPAHINPQERHINYKMLPVNELSANWSTSFCKIPLTSKEENLAIVMANNKKKKPQPFPEECKDELYWERRKRNNESAKKSRAIRKIKEQQTSVRVLRLEQENLQLKTEVALLKDELDRLQKLLYQKTAADS